MADGLQAKFVFLDDITENDGKAKDFVLTEQMEELLQKRYKDSGFKPICETMTMKIDDIMPKK